MWRRVCLSVVVSCLAFASQGGAHAESLDTMSFAFPTEQESRKSQMDMLVMIGSVTATTARVVYEPLVDDDAPITVSLIVQDDVVSEHMHAHRQAFPYAMAFRDLTPHSTYYVTFRQGNTVRAVARFRTPAVDITDDKLVVLALSCDRYLHDFDNSHWATLVQVHSPPSSSFVVHANTTFQEVHDPAYFGTVHMGDQIYSDHLLANFQHAPFDSVLRAFRGLYRRNFGRPLAQRLLRQGAHYMMVDDHDLLNNWSRAFFVQHEAFARAALQAFYEYQYQLLADLDLNAMAFETAPRAQLYRPVHHAVSLGTDQLKLVFVDTRLERGLTMTSKQLVSDAQLAFLEAELSHGNASTEVVVFSPLPLFFHSHMSADVSHFFDNEYYPGHKYFTQSMQKLWQLLPSTSVLLVAGDLHMAHSATVCDARQTKCLPQIISSGMTVESTSMKDRKLVLFHYLVTQWFQKASCLWGIVTQSPGGVCVHSDMTFYGQNYAKLTWEQGLVTSEFVTKPYVEPTDMVLQVCIDPQDISVTHCCWAICTYALDFRVLVAVVAISLLRWWF
ncbi:Aste57867_6949 [Aphanomyces stellatus]|uniref:Aste57867_6949 protein n=1 Tax=Aphanomyces stellatus TaxID=120398 RepID=A0A485KFX7_9STRA|nr:hypothetical protein As57867_006927 [Aphanomyces stellatus]VFT83901.1 Aste57867_6949 [Aphanomyces stellatus]